MKKCVRWRRARLRLSHCACCKSILSQFCVLGQALSFAFSPGPFAKRLTRDTGISSAPALSVCRAYRHCPGLLVVPAAPCMPAARLLCNLYAREDLQAAILRGVTHPAGRERRCSKMVTARRVCGDACRPVGNEYRDVFVSHGEGSACRKSVDSTHGLAPDIVYRLGSGTGRQSEGELGPERLIGL